MGFVVGAFLIAHGVYGLYVGQALRLFELKPGFTWPDGSWALSGLIGNPATHAVTAVLFSLVAAGFAVSGIALIAGHSWWGRWPLRPLSSRPWRWCFSGTDVGGGSTPRVPTRFSSMERLWWRRLRFTGRRSRSNSASDHGRVTCFVQRDSGQAEEVPPWWGRRGDPPVCRGPGDRPGNGAGPER